MQVKPFEIPKKLVWKSYKKVCSNKGAAGIDKQTIFDFNKKKEKNLYKIWNRLSSGTYFPPPVLAKSIPKADGTERILGIPTVSDRIAQGAIKLQIEEQLEVIFHKDSYGYRPRKSAHQALDTCAKRCWKYEWVVEIDISQFFDKVKHELVIKALKQQRLPEWVVLYCKRWLEAPIQVDAKRTLSQAKRAIGTPQGGVISPLLANLFLHYAFDKWMDRTHSRIPFERYADDIVCHCNWKGQAEKLKVAITERLREVGLEINSRKSSIVYIGQEYKENVNTSFTFLGYDFKLRTLKSLHGELFRRCRPGASMKAMKYITKTIRSWKLHYSTSFEIETFAFRYNPILRGWIQYYGKFERNQFRYRLNLIFTKRLLRWIKKKYRVGARKAYRRFERIKANTPKLFVNWYLFSTLNG